MKRLWALTAAAMISLLLPGISHGDIFRLRAEVHGGVGGGEGLGGEQKDDAFHAGAGGILYGAIVGGEVLFIDVWVEHHQHLSDDGLTGTWTQFMLGFDTEIDLSKPVDGQLHSDSYVELGVGVGYGLGTGQQVMPPLDNSEITDKGFVAQATFGLGYRITSVLSIGLVIPIQGAYLFKSGPGLAANDRDNQYSSIQGAALLVTRLEVGIR